MSRLSTTDDRAVLFGVRCHKGLVLFKTTLNRWRQNTFGMTLIVSENIFYRK